MAEGRAADEPATALVPVTDFASTQFSHRVSLDRQELIDSLKERADVHWYDGRPDPFPKDSLPFQAWSKGEVIFVRRMVETERAKSPIVALRVAPGGRGHIVHGAFVRRPVVRNDNTQKILRVTVILMWISLFGSIVGSIVGALFNPFQFIGYAIAIPWAHHLLRQGEAPDRASMELHGQTLRALVGELLIPHELGEAQGPFRGLPSGSTDR